MLEATLGLGAGALHETKAWAQLEAKLRPNDDDLQVFASVIGHALQATTPPERRLLLGWTCSGEATLYEVKADGTATRVSVAAEFCRPNVRDTAGWWSFCAETRMIRQYL